MLLGNSTGSVRPNGPLTKGRKSKCLALRVSAVVSQDRKLRDPREENVPGDFFVDNTCIDCDTCRWMAPETYGRYNEQSAIHKQPESQEDRKRAMQALLACPTFSIHARHKSQGELGAALDGMPVPVPGTDNLFHLVMTSEASFGAASYLIRRPEGNVMVDSPRFDKKLLKRIQAMGGAKWMCLSHRDDVCDHAKWTEALGCERIFHDTECNASQGTDQVEHKLKGDGPWSLPDGSPDVELIFTPGHTEGHVATLFKPERVLLSGDHWGWSGWEQRGSLFRAVNWYDIPLQRKSLAALRALDFIHVLPGHGRPMSFKDRAAKDEYIDLTLQAEQAEDAEAGAASRTFAQSGVDNPFLYRLSLAGR